MKKSFSFLFFLLFILVPSSFVSAATKPIINVSAKVIEDTKGQMLKVTALSMDENGDAVDITTINVEGQSQKCQKYYYCQLTFGPFNFAKSKNVKYYATATLGKVVVKSVVKNFLIKATPKSAVVKDDDIRIKARDAYKMSNLKQLQTALELYYTDKNVYPSGQNIILGTKNYFCLNEQGWQPKGCKGPYMAQVLGDSINGQVIYSKISKNYKIQTKLEGAVNGLRGTIFATPEGIKDAAGNSPKIETVRSPSNDQLPKPSSAQLRDRTRLTDLKQIQTALEIYYNDVGSYPIANNVVLGDNNHACLNPYGWQPSKGCSDVYKPVSPLMGNVPADPGGKSYIYKSDGKSYTITAELEVGGFNNLKAGKILVTPSGLENK